LRRLGERQLTDSILHRKQGMLTRCSEPQQCRKLQGKTNSERGLVRFDGIPAIRLRLSSGTKLDEAIRVLIQIVAHRPASCTRTLVTTAIGAALIGLRQDQTIQWKMRDDRMIERLTDLTTLPARLWPPLLSA
jgi:hypothetical protein